MNWSEAVGKDFKKEFRATLRAAMKAARKAQWGLSYTPVTKQILTAMWQIEIAMEKCSVRKWGK